MAVGTIFFFIFPFLSAIYTQRNIIYLVTRSQFKINNVRCAQPWMEKVILYAASTMMKCSDESVRTQIRARWADKRKNYTKWSPTAKEFPGSRLKRHSKGDRQLDGDLSSKFEWVLGHLI